MPSKILDDSMDILDVINSVDEGRFKRDADAELHAVLRSVMRYYGAGSVTVTINLKNDGDDAVTISAELAVKHPKRKGRVKSLYLDGQGNLFEQPQQLNDPVATAYS